MEEYKSIVFLIISISIILSFIKKLFKLGFILGLGYVIYIFMQNFR